MLLTPIAIPKILHEIRLPAELSIEQDSRRHEVPVTLLHRTDVAAGKRCADACQAPVEQIDDFEFREPLIGASDFRSLAVDDQRSRRCWDEFVIFGEEAVVGGQDQLAPGCARVRAVN